MSNASLESQRLIMDTSATANLTLQVTSGASFDVREFDIDEQISTLFQIRLLAVCADPDLDFDAIVGHDARFSISADQAAHRRSYRGICRNLEAVSVEDTGISTYALTLVPALWLTTQRRNYRIFQALSEPEIVQQLLDEWRIPYTMRIDPGAYAKRKYRAQYAESDFSFLSRMLEDAGVSYLFESTDTATTLVLTDAPQSAEPRPEPLPYYNGSEQEASREAHVSQVRIEQQVRPGSYTLADLDHRRPPEQALVAGAAESSAGPERGLEQYHYVPGAFLFATDGGEHTPYADDRGQFRTDERAGAALAHKRLEATRADAKLVSFRTNALDLSPGNVFSIARHPRSDLAENRRQLVLQSRLHGSHDGAWEHRVLARSAELSFRPLAATPKPTAQGVESATVVGPPGEEIHTDEFGRIRVHFHWDRRASRDADSSCWIPVSQPWAGTGFGAIHLPRVGQEVLVDFLAGDPDRPVIVGRVYTRLQSTPYPLPEHKTRSGWRSMTTPGGGGYNEIAFEDRAGAERIDMQAERDLVKLVKNDEQERTLNDRRAEIGRNRQAQVGAKDTLEVGERHHTTVAGSTELEMRASYVRLTTGSSTITLDGPNVTIDAETITLNARSGIDLATPGNLALSSQAGDVSVSSGSGTVRINGGPMVKINT